MNKEVKTLETTTTTTTEVKKAKRQAKLWHFKDGDYAIPAKIKCAKCGREVAGYAPLVYERVMTKYDGSWQKYLEEFTCGDCKRKVKDAVKAQINAEKEKQEIEKAKALLECKGMAVVNTLQAAKPVQTKIVKK